tara:strand:- start:340 stop:810 length:471 start_codon:yes stop_codon:yes gene_type:complete
MVFRAKVLKTTCRFKDETGEGVRLQLDLDEKIVEGIAYLANFPCGLLAPGAIFDGIEIDIIPVYDKIKCHLIRYEVLAWSNQHDSIKAFAMSFLLSSMSKAYLDQIPLESDQSKLSLEGELFRKKLDKIFYKDKTMGMETFEVLEGEIDDLEEDND